MNSPGRSSKTLRNRVLPLVENLRQAEAAKLTASVGSAA